MAVWQVGDVTVDAQGNSGQAVFCLGHGAGGDMNAPLLVQLQARLVQAGLAAVRYNFPYTEKGRKAPDKAEVLIETTQRVVAEVIARLQPRRLILGGKSMGGRMASMLVAQGQPADGLVFLGYPLHPMGKTDKLRKPHLFDIPCPMLFLSGSRDGLARRDLLEGTVAELGSRARLVLMDGGDHSLVSKGVDTVDFCLQSILRWYHEEIEADHP